MVYVVSKDNKPLMPTRSAKAAWLLKTGKAKCIRRVPFTIKLLYETTEYTQKLIHGIDPGSSVLGSSVTDEKGNVLYMAKVEVRNDITGKMKRRAAYRRVRRSRKTRYRQMRVKRRNTIREGRIPPTVRSKIHSHLKEVNSVAKILPISKVIVETASFDTHALKNPAVLSNKWLYQKGLNYGFANTKAYVLHRDKYQCQQCKSKRKGIALHVHHIVHRADNGSDDESNLITLCKDCHQKVHDGSVTLKKIGKRKDTLMHASQMNVIKSQIMKTLNCEETFGFVTKEHRQKMGLSKEHYIDAAVIASGGVDLTFKTKEYFHKKSVSAGDYRQTKGERSEDRLPTGKIMGFRKFDKVEHLGQEYFVKGRMSTGYAILMDVTGAAVKLKPIPKFDGLKRLGARKTCLIQAQTAQNII